MSQVIVTEDRLRDKRQKSGIQEKNIAKELEFERWRRSDVTKSDAFQKIVGLAVYPVVVLWGIILGLIYLVVRVFRGVIGVFGKLNSKG